MSDLRVDYYRLENSVRDLGTIKSEFDDLEARRRRNEEIWGHGGVRDAMGEVASNWTESRKKLSPRIHGIGEKLETVLSTFRKTDADLAKSFDEAPDAAQQRGAL
ncbi:hypothetical protein [Mumia zhuanghuii]|uniref:Uncharacterized protein n=1 Tax=Mumia zhuanghuii TaxID=2585211 RepID=A0A5C4MF83_9ACTN|nr:hypothetical protein [Mumia zhuanghuii]TNC33105.1 hypothetical protein FHE65_29510 [Mumia zhuanghuii]TNC44265.1 hypothetical protein FHE65_16780 [Mumia zhuanghuii]